MDQPGEALAHGFGGKTEGGSLVRVEVLDQEVGASQEPIEDEPPDLSTKIQCDTQLVSVEQEEEAAPLGMRLIVEEGAVASSPFSARRLHLDDLGPKVGEALAGVRGGDKLADLHHPKPGQGPHGSADTAEPQERADIRRAVEGEDFVLD